MKNYDNEFISQFLDGNAGYKVQVEEQTEDGGWFPNVIGESVVIGTGDFEEDLSSAIWHALRDADNTRKYGVLEFETV